MGWDPNPKGPWEKKDREKIVRSGIHSNSVGTHMKVLSASQEENCTENQCWWHCAHGLWALRTVTKLIYYLYKACCLSYFLWQKGKEISKLEISKSSIPDLVLYILLPVSTCIFYVYLYFCLAHMIFSFNRYCCCSCLYSKSFSKKILKSGAFSPE